ncbi:hypothetical protein CLOSTHATH_01425 [Hungatella hathewayi DSM 13479]|uniref:Uncharacterized protein n=1 Tax=Hungatella hathewayi DSM 13479 TaxID=566550 RepID=D3ACU7_9FIRM|nr:hypothetical protein CLOSTHATH_01425 [Hungatella hathewayi DSM 13479]
MRLPETGSLCYTSIYKTDDSLYKKLSPPETGFCRHSICLFCLAFSVRSDLRNPPYRN